MLVRATDMPRRALCWMVVLLAGALVLAGLGPADALAKPNLVVSKLGNPPRTASPGASFRVVDTTANRGRNRSGRTATGFHLSADRKRGRGDLRLQGARTVAALRAGARSTGSGKRRAQVTIPPQAPAGTYVLLACADERDAVRESSEGDNCRAAKRKVRVAAAVAVPSPSGLIAFGDVTTSPDPASDEQQLVARKAMWCTPMPAVEISGLPKALANSEAHLKARAGAQDFAAFLRSKEAKTAKQAQRAAAGAMLFEQPGAALAAMLRAHRLEPREASHLINAAGLATSIGLPNEALAMLDAAQRLKDRDRPAMGISHAAVAHANRAHALTSIGSYDAAQRSADAALRAAPLLAEAQQTAGTAELCAGRTQQAVARIRKGRNRQPGKEPPLDDSQARETGLRGLPLPTTPEQAVAAHAPFRAMMAAQSAEIQRHNDRDRELRQRINARGAYPGRALDQMLLTAVRTSGGSTPALKALEDEVGALREKSHAWYREKWCDGDSCADEEYAQIRAACDGDKTCVRSRCVPATKDWQQGWLNDNNALHERSDAYLRALSRRMSGIASHIKDPDTYALAMMAIETRERSLHFGRLQAADYWTYWVRSAREDCVAGSEPPPAEPGPPAAGQGSGPCPDGLKSVNAVLDLGIATFKANCSEVQLGGSLGQGWIKGFAEVTYDFRSGKTTLFAGSQAEVGVGVKADFKSGIYVTATSQGITDIGMRAGPGSNAGAGPVEFSGPSDSVDISFVAAFATD